MESNDLNVFDEMPFFAWVKDEEGKHRWMNRALREFAQTDPIGKTDHEMPWAAAADSLRAADKKVLETGKPLYLQEHADMPGQGQVTLSVCKFPVEFEGERCTCGVSFVVG
jgi:two-component system aerobic respiration control sensor histidine kinase ArcB